MLPSSASSLSLILRDAASEISDIEKNALTAIRQSMTKILFNISYLTVEIRSSEGKWITLSGIHKKPVRRPWTGDSTA